MVRYSAGGGCSGVYRLAYIKSTKVASLAMKKMQLAAPCQVLNGRVAAIIAAFLPWHKACRTINGDNY